MTWTGNTEGRYNRHKCAKLVIRMIIALSRESMTIRMLSIKFEIHTKTVRRYLAAIQDLGVPLYEEDNYDDDERTEHWAGRKQIFYRIDKHWMKWFI